MSTLSAMPNSSLKVYHDKFLSIVSEDSKAELVANGFMITEGPVWNTSEKFLLFSDIPANKIYRWSQKEGLKVFREPTGNSNGLTYDKKGGLIICEHSNRRLARLDKDCNYTVLIDKFNGKRLNSPNDVVVKSDGTIYFTDPPYGIKPEEQELPFQGVFHLNPENGESTLLADDFDRPNGLVFSQDESQIYIADSSSRSHVRVFDVKEGGTLSNGHVFAEIHSRQKAEYYVDGMKVDMEGNLYVTAASGIWVYSNKGKKLGIIKTPESAPTNCAWGEDDWRTLFITSRTSVRRIKLKIPGTNRNFLFER